MARYFFHVHDGRKIFDEEGTDLPSIREAKRCAVQLAGALLRDDAEYFWKGREWRMDVADAHGQTLLSLTFTARAPLQDG